MPDEYISREAALMKLMQDGCSAKNLQSISDMPSADVAEVVHGRWIDGAEDFTCGNHNAECSICRCYVSWDGCDEDFNYWKTTKKAKSKTGSLTRLLTIWTVRPPLTP